ncbi:MAG: type II secretion protein ATPase [Alphaproteobacteria bacterium]|nr:type II secretion protein ATPase [Alphaproteobacteria bacterium]
MNGENITSILLPASRVDFHVLDDGTAALAQQLVTNWRFARVGIQIERSGMEAAINYYKEAPAPELIIIETNDIGEDFLQQLKGLAGVCPPGTDAVIIGPKNDVHLYRHLVEMGVKDYLVRPVSEVDMVKVIARTLIEKRGMSGSRLVTVIGSKGGVGTTSVAQILAWDIAEGLKQKTMLMDAAGSAGSVGIAYGLEPSTTLIEAVRLGKSGSDDDMKRVYQVASEHLSVLACGGEPLLTGSPDPDSVETLVNRLMQKYPVVVMDLSGASRSVQKRLMERASEIVVVTTPMLSALRNARTLMGELKTLKSHLKEVDLVVNMRGVSSSEEVPLQDIKEALNMSPSAVIPYAPRIFATSEATGKPVGKNKEAQKIMDMLMPIAEKSSAVKRKGNGEDSEKNFDLMRVIRKTLGG